MQLPPFAITFAVQLVIYMLLWIWYDYLATIVSLIFGLICFSILAIAIMAEWIERTRINRRFFSFILAGFLAPLVAYIFYAILGGGMKWMS